MELSMTPYQIFLFILMVVTGCTNTLAMKWMDTTYSKGRDDRIRRFHHPFIQTLVMFAGQILCLITFKFLYRIVRERCKNCSVSDDVFSKGSDQFKPIILLMPAMCDMVASSFLFIGLNLTYASSFQMLKGGVIVFVGILSVFFLKKTLLPRQMNGILLVTVALIFVGMADYMDNDQPKANVKNTIIGDCLIVLSQSLAAMQFVIEEKYISEYDLSPLEVAGWEGLFGFSVLGILQIPLYFIKVSKPFASGPRGVLEDGIDAIIQIGNDSTLIILFSVIPVTIAGYNFAGISITKELSAITRMILDSLNTLVIWIVSLMFLGEPFSWMQLVGFMMLVFGMAIYHGLIDEKSFYKSIRNSGEPDSE